VPSYNQKTIVIVNNHKANSNIQSMNNLAEDVNMIAGEQHAQPTQELIGGQALAQLNNG